MAESGEQHGWAVVLLLYPVSAHNSLAMRLVCTRAQSHEKQTPLIGLLLLLMMNTAGSVDATYERVDVGEITLSVAFAGATAESTEQTWPMD